MVHTYPRTNEEEIETKDTNNRNLPVPNQEDEKDANLGPCGSGKLSVENDDETAEIETEKKNSYEQDVNESDTKSNEAEKVDSIKKIKGNRQAGTELCQAQPQAVLTGFPLASGQLV